MSYLIHHGIKGQKWGVRRYQTEDGALTSAGAARYIDDPGNRFRWGDHAGENHSKMNPVARVAVAAGRAQNILRGAQSAVERSGLGNIARKAADKISRKDSSNKTAQPATTKKTTSKKPEKEKMSPERKKALAKKIAIGVGVVGLAAATAYVVSKTSSKKSPQSFVERMLENQEFDKSQNRRLENMHNAWKKGFLTDAQFQERHNAIIADVYKRAKGLI